MTQPNPLIADLSAALTNKHYGRALDLTGELVERLSENCRYGETATLQIAAVSLARLCREGTTLSISELCQPVQAVLGWRSVADFFGIAATPNPEIAAAKDYLRVAFRGRLELAAEAEPAAFMTIDRNRESSGLLGGSAQIGASARTALRTYAETTTAHPLSDRLTVLGTLALLGDEEEAKACAASAANLLSPKALANCDIAATIMDIGYVRDSALLVHDHRSGEKPYYPLPSPILQHITGGLKTLLQRAATDEAFLAMPAISMAKLIECLRPLCWSPYDERKEHAPIQQLWPEVVNCASALLRRAPEEALAAMTEAREGYKSTLDPHGYADSLHKAATLQVVREPDSPLSLSSRWHLMVSGSYNPAPAFHEALIETARAGLSQNVVLPDAMGQLSRIFCTRIREHSDQSASAKALRASAVVLTLELAEVYAKQRETDGGRRYFDGETAPALLALGDHIPWEMHARFADLCRGRASIKLAGHYQSHSAHPAVLHEAMAPAAYSFGNRPAAEDVAAFVAAHQPKAAKADQPAKRGPEGNRPA